MGISRSTASASNCRSVSDVAMTSDATALAVIPRDPTSRGALFAPCRAPLAADQSTCPRFPSIPLTNVMVMIRPHGMRIMGRKRGCVTLEKPFNVTSRTVFQFSADILTRGPFR